MSLLGSDQRRSHSRPVLGKDNGGITSLINAKGNRGRYGLGYKPTQADVKRSITATTTPPRHRVATIMHPNPYHYHPYKPKLPMTTLLSPPQIQTIVATSFINLNPHKDLVATMIPNPLPRPCHPYQSKPMTIVVRDLSCGQVNRSYYITSTLGIISHSKTLISARPTTSEKLFY